MELTYKINADGTAATCTGLADKDYDGEVVIPEYYEGVRVVGIGYEAFKGAPITAVTVPKTVTLISMLAFAYCKRLERVTFAEGARLELIDGMAFRGCSALKIRLPDGLKVIERMAFSDCAVELPDRALVMEPNFECCRVSRFEPDLPPLAPIERDGVGSSYRLNETGDGYVLIKGVSRGGVITVPESFNGLPVAELGNMAFSGEDEATRTVIPASVRKAGYFPFYGCDDMLYAEYGGTVEEWKSMDIYAWFDVGCSDGTVAGRG